MLSQSHSDLKMSHTGLLGVSRQIETGKSSGMPVVQESTWSTYVQDLKELTDEELMQLPGLVTAEQKRRSVINSAPVAIAKINRQYTAAIGRKPDSVWRKPTGAHDAYDYGETAEFDGKLYRSLRTGNTDQPNAASWRQVVDVAAGELADWIQPSGAHDAYSFGDEVAHGGHRWVSRQFGEGTNTWEPGVYGWDDKGEIVPDDEPPVIPDNAVPAFKQPTGAHDAYSFGDRVTYQGNLWTNVHPGLNTNTWKPGEYGWNQDGPVVP